MLVFALRWAPFGGGDAYDIFCGFGLDVTTFFTRIIALVTSSTYPGLDEIAQQRLLKVAHQRLDAVRPDPQEPHDEQPA